MAFNFKFAGTVILLNMLCFIATFGQKNLIDLFIKIQYKLLSTKKKFTLGITTFTYLLSISIIVTTLIEFKINQHFSIATFNEEIKNIGKGYFPIEVFGNYLDINVTSVKVENTNRIVTPSEPSSFIMNMQLPQRQIVAFINEKVKKDHNERKKLCSLLLNYSYSNPWTYSDAMQTKFVLVNVKRVNLFASIQTIYTYYYDDKTPIHSFYGGYNPDSLSKYYEKIQRDYFDSYISILSKELELPQDTVLKYMNENGSLVLPEGIKVKVTNKKIPLSFKAEIGGTAFTTVLFENVEPIQFVQLNFPPGHINYSFSYSSLEALRSTEAEDRMFNIKMNYVFSR
ncbi:MAG TPA: hypothetical protein VGN63_19045 [Flavisolibacter sp.]|nr:hypothetical protein [Flavisolibacter sp.]